MIYYTDGSAHPNPGPGGFGVVLVHKNGTYESYNMETQKTTNNAEEMKAIIWAMADAIKRGESAEIFSDSSYAINTFTKWYPSWKRNGWVKGDGKVPENLELVKAYDELSQYITPVFHHIRGHAGIKYNEMADKLATGKMTGTLNLSYALMKETLGLPKKVERIDF